MRKSWFVTTLALVALGMSGCPWWFQPRKQQFTNADRSAGWRYGDQLDGIGGAPAEGTDGGATAPREVVEPDVTRRVDSLLFVLNQYRGLTLVDLNSEQIVAQLPTYGYPRDLYVDGTRAYVLVAYATDYTTQGNTISFSIKSRLYVVDISQPEAAAILGTFALEGDLVDSRLVGDVLYAVGAEYQWYWIEPVVGGAEPAVNKVMGNSWVTSVNVADPSHIFEADQISFPGTGNVIQATSSAIFVAAADWYAGDSSVTYVDISDPAGTMAVRGTVSVRGQIADRFKMDVYNGVLRVVSSAWEDTRLVYITTVDLSNPDQLTVLAETDFERARGDALFATRFDGNRAYVVTYFMVDPLFVLDLSDPANPQVSGVLEVPGWSTHIEPQGDRLIALGVDVTDGRRVSVSLFDVADPANPSLVDRVSFGDQWSWSSAYSDVKAFTVLDDVIIVPFSGWTDTFGGYERLQFVSYTAQDLASRGYVDVNGAVLRSFEYDGAFYGVTSEQLVTIDGANLDQPTVTGRLVLAENVTDFVELSSTLGAEIITRYDTGVTLVKTVGLPLKSLGEVEVNVGSMVDTYTYGDTVVVVGAVWNEAPHYFVAIIDCSDPALPAVASTVKVDVQPHVGYWWPLPYDVAVAGPGGVDMGGGAVGSSGGVAPDASSGKLLAPWWFPVVPQESTFLFGDRLVLRCVADHFDTVFGDSTPYEGLAVVNLATPAWDSTIGLGFENIQSLDAAGSKLYLGTKDSAGRDLTGPLASLYLTEIDVAGPSAGPSVNVPGLFVQYDPAGDLLVVKDEQWEFGGVVDTSLRSMSWNGSGSVTLIDRVSLPPGTSQVLGRASKVYVDAYDSGYRLYAVSVAASGDLSLSEGVLVTDQWGSLLDGHENSAYLTIGGGAIVRYDVSGAPTLGEIVQVMGTPMRLRFGADAAYAPLGYFGLVELSL
ncbi:MAG: beta-propeller domain-containing protein [Candidatus Hydrogenedentes bacterium]|nr:beta-propeller domain-containing protein [Candidatus Hydrogenedentota bacterium]